MTSHALGNRARAAVSVLVTILLVITAVVASGLPARAAAGDVTNATLNWGLKESFRNYLVGPIAHGGWALSGGVTDSPAFTWSGGTGNYDAGLGTGSVGYPGSIRFTGHETPAGSGNFVLDVTIADVRIVKTGATTAQLIVDGTSSGTSYPDAVFAEVDLAGATASTDGATISYTAAPATLTAVGSQIMQAFYPAGAAIDPVTFSWPVEQAAPPTTTSVAALPAAGAEAGASVTFTATVTPDDAAGTVQFRDGTNALGAPVAVTAGVAALTTTGLSVGDHSITAEFVPSAGHAGSASVAVAYGIVAAPLASGAAWGLSNYLNSANFGRPNPSPTNYGAPATFNATTRISTWAEGSTDDQSGRHGHPRLRGLEREPRQDRRRLAPDRGARGHARQVRQRRRLGRRLLRNDEPAGRLRPGDPAGTRTRARRPGRAHWQRRRADRGPRRGNLGRTEWPVECRVPDFPRR